MLWLIVNVKSSQAAGAFFGGHGQQVQTMQSNATLSREDIFRTLPIHSALAKMVLPAVASQLIVLIYNMADTFYVGQTNNPYMVAAT